MAVTSARSPLPRPASSRGRLTADVSPSRIRDRSRARVVCATFRDGGAVVRGAEEKLSEIQDRYMEYNAHAGSYTWKRLYEGSFVEMDMDLTLGENSVPDESDEFESLGVDADLYIPVIHVYFNDDLTYA